MTKTLSAEDWLSRIRAMFDYTEKGPAWTNNAMEEAIEIIEAKDQEIEALKGQVAALSTELSELKLMIKKL